MPSWTPTTTSSWSRTRSRILSECVQAGLPRLWLSWHYRSRDESLITFSNAQYYDDRLSSFPAFPGQLYDTGVSFTRVDGTFLRSGRKSTDVT